MKFISTLFLFLCSSYLFGQEISIKAENKKIEKDFIERFEYCQEVLRKFFDSNKLDTIVKYRPELSVFKRSFIRYKTHSDSIKTIPDEYNFSYDFLKDQELIANFDLRVSGDEEIQKKLDEWNSMNLVGIKIIVKGESLISKDSINKISQIYYPNRQTLIQLDNNYNPFNNRENVNYYWTIKLPEDMNKREYEFIRVDLITGQIETMILRNR
jgi:hypothetical protein